MDLDYFIFYTEASLVCIVVLALFLINDKLNSAKQEKQLCFDRTIIAFMLYFACDACWAGMLSGQILRTRALSALVNLINFILLGVMSYEWFMFMAASEKMEFRNDRKNRAACLLPLLVSLTFMVTAYAADPDFWIGEQGELNALYYPVMLSAPTVYLLVALVFSMINAKKTEDKKEKKHYWLLAVIPLGVMGFGMIQLTGLNAPTFCFGCTLMLLFFYIQNLQALISVDELTQLNDRGQIERYMDQTRSRENARAFVMMLDIDRFKQINDEYGHAEGDRALVLVSEALKQTCERLKARVFLGRYGGDEFIVIIQDTEEDTIAEQAIRVIRAALAETQRTNELPYELEISAGYDELRGREDTLRRCMIRADEKLYEEKRAKGAGR